MIGYSGSTCKINYHLKKYSYFIGIRSCCMRYGYMCHRVVELVPCIARKKVACILHVAWVGYLQGQHNLGLLNYSTKTEIT